MALENLLQNKAIFWYSLLYGYLWTFGCIKLYKMNVIKFSDGSMSEERAERKNHKIVGN